MIKMPEQKISLKEKQKKEKGKDYSKFGANNIDKYLELVTFSTNEDNEVKEVYEMYNGTFGDRQKKQYKSITDPFGSGGNLPSQSQLKHWPVMFSRINKFLGDKRKRGFTYRVKSLSEDAVSRNEESLKKQITEIFEQTFVNSLNDGGINTGIESRDVETPEDVEKLHKKKYKDIRSVNMQDLMTTVIDDKNIKNKFNDAYKDFLLAGSPASFKEVNNGDIIYEIVNPLDIKFVMSPDTIFGEDGEAAVRRKYMYVSQIIDKYRDKLTDKQISKLDSGESNTAENVVWDSGGNYDKRIDTNRLKTLYHIVWRSMMKIGYYKYIDENGEEQEEPVSEDFKDKNINKEAGESIKWEWITQIWQGKKVDEIYFDIGPIDVNQYDISNPSLDKLPYNTIMFSDKNAPNTSLGMLVKPFNFYYNIYMYRLDHLIASSKGKIGLVDVASIAKSLGGKNISFEQIMYYADTLKMLLLDSSAEGAGNFSNWGTLDLELRESIIAQLEVTASLLKQLDELLGLPPSQKGEISPRDGKAVTEYSLEQSSTITEPIIAKFEEFEERELMGILNYAREAYYKGKSGMHITSDLQNIFYNIDEQGLSEEEYGITIDNSMTNYKRIQQLKGFSQSFIAKLGQGISAGQIWDIIRREDSAGITAAMDKADESYKEFIQQQQESASKQEQAKMANDEKIANDKETRIDAREQLKSDTDIRVAQIRAAGFEEETSIKDVSPIDMSKLSLEEIKEGNKNKKEQSKLDFEKKVHKDNIKQDNKKMVHEKWMKKQDLKNPVVGEKKVTKN